MFENDDRLPKIFQQLHEDQRTRRVMMSMWERYEARKYESAASSQPRFTFHADSRNFMNSLRAIVGSLLAVFVISGSLLTTSGTANASEVVSITFVGVGSATAVSAQQSTSSSETAKVRAAAIAYVARDSGVSARSLRATFVKVSTVNPAYSYVYANSQFGPVEVLLSKVGRTWRVVNYGTGGFDCNDAPLAVMRNVGATVYECVPGQRYFVYSATQKKVIAAAMIHAKYYVLNSDGARLSKKGLAKQLAFEKFPTYAINAVASSIKANWNANATVTGWRYLELGVSPGQIHDQLVFDGFTSAEASYAVRHLYDN